MSTLITGTVAKIGTTRRGPRTRIWLEGRRLSAAGFHHGATYERSEGRNSITLTLHPAGTLKVAGTPTRPIIDMTGKFVSETFATESVVVEYFEGRIEITGVAE